MPNKIIIFTQWVVCAEEIEKKLQSYLKKTKIFLVTGKNKNKFEEIKNFKKYDGNAILVASDCINYGVSIPEADKLIHFDLNFSPSKMEQREGRIDRITQKNKMLIIKLISEDSVEEKVVKLLETKQHMFNTVVDGTDAATSKSLLAELFK